jgi:phosphomannomutase
VRGGRPVGRLERAAARRPTGKVAGVPGDLDAVFKAYDIRGTVPDQLDPELARRVGAAFAAFAGAPAMLVARDMRPSGEELAAAF